MDQWQSQNLRNPRLNEIKLNNWATLSGITIKSNTSIEILNDQAIKLVQSNIKLLL